MDSLTVVVAVAIAFFAFGVLGCRYIDRKNAKENAERAVQEAKDAAE